jgi:hypothetical protein
MREAFESLAKKAGESTILVHEIEATYKAKWLLITYCQIGIFQGFGEASLRLDLRAAKQGRAVAERLRESRFRVLPFPPRRRQ